MKLRLKSDSKTLTGMEHDGFINTGPTEIKPVSK